MPNDLGVKIAGLILRRKGELSRSEISVLVEDDEETDLVISMLVNSMHAEIQQRKVESSSILEWEDYVVLLPPIASPSQI